MELGLIVRHLERKHIFCLGGCLPSHSATLCTSPNAFLGLSLFTVVFVGRIRLSERSVRIKGGDRTQMILAR